MCDLLKEVLSGLGLVGLFVGLFWLVGLAGSVDCDMLTTSECLSKLIIPAVILLVSAVILIKVEKDKDMYV